MVRTCLAGIDGDKVAMFGVALREAGALASATVARLDVAELGKMTPDLLVCDIDALRVDPLEMVRRLRFVLPDCVIAVYTGDMRRTWGVSCHLAGANCLLAKGSTRRQLSSGLRGAVRTGCYTDPRFSRGDDAVAAFGHVRREQPVRSRAVRTVEPIESPALRSSDLATRRFARK